jgi:hypothetical protein
MTDRSRATTITWSQGGLWHRIRFEPRSDGGFDRIEEVRHAQGGTWRPRGSERVESVSVERPVGTADAGP